MAYNKSFFEFSSLNIGYRGHQLTTGTQNTLIWAPS